MSPTTEAPQRAQIDAAISEGYDKKPAAWINSPGFSVNDATGILALYVRDQFWSRHECQGDECSADSGCPSAPAWQPRLEDLYIEAVDAMEADFLASAKRRVSTMIEQFAAEYPDAPRAKVELPA